MESDAFLKKMSISFHVSLLLTIEMIKYKWPQKAIDFSSTETQAETQSGSCHKEMRKSGCAQAPDTCVFAHGDGATFFGHKCVLP